MKHGGVTTSAHDRWPTLIILARYADFTTAAHESWPLIILARVVVQNKRCLLAYHSQRLDTITTAYWTAGGAVTHVISQLRDDMSRDEINYLREYHQSVVEYRQQLSPTDVIDFTMGIEDPPRESSFVTVETMRNIGGPIHTESGLLDFQLGHQYVLLKRDVEHLILQGYLREV